MSRSLNFQDLSDFQEIPKGLFTNYIWSEVLWLGEDDIILTDQKKEGREKIRKIELLNPYF